MRMFNITNLLKWCRRPKQDMNLGEERTGHIAEAIEDVAGVTIMHHAAEDTRRTGRGRQDPMAKSRCSSENDFSF